MIFTDTQVAELAALVFRDDYPGYRPDVRELPNGDGKVDEGKRYAHVATKYLKYTGKTPNRILRDLEGVLIDAHCLAGKVANALGVPSVFWPSLSDSALRILEYPAGSGSHSHTDFDLFTLHLYASPGHRFQCALDHRTQLPAAALAINPGLHLGELAELIGIGPATPHSVDPAPAGGSRSIVYFAMPSPDAVLPDGRRVGEWLDERKGRSRVQMEMKPWARTTK